MASTKVRPTPPPGGPALVRPAVGALLLTLSGMACGGDDDVSSNDTANASEPPMLASDGPMPNPTTNEPPMLASDGPMPNPTTGESESLDTGTSTGGQGDTVEPPMPPTTGDSSSSGGSGSDSGSSGSVPPMPPPKPDPVHDDDQD